MPFKRGTWTTFTTDQGLPAAHIYKILIDKAGTVWAGTSAGLARFDGREFVSFGKADGMIDDVVTALFQEQQGAIWIDTPKGLSRYDPKARGQQFANFKMETTGPERGVHSIVQTRDGKIWVSTARGLAWFDGRAFQLLAMKGGPRSPKELALAGDGRIWVASWSSGLWQFDGARFSEVPLGDFLPTDQTGCPTLTAEGGAWFQASGYGVGHCQGGAEKPALKFLSLDDGLLSDLVTAIHVAADKSLWLGSPDKGASRYDGMGLIHFTTKDGLADNHIHDIQSLPDGTIWFATSKGLSRVLPRRLYSFYPG